MEMHIIKTLHWQLNPPTPFLYLTIISPLFDDFDTYAIIEDHDDTPITTKNNRAMIELARYLIELSVCDDYFVDKKPSCIAHAAISVAVDTL